MLEAKHMGRTVDATENYRGRARRDPALLTDDDVICLLAAACEKAGSRANWAKANGFTVTFVNYVFSGQRKVSDRMAEKIGVRRAPAWTWRGRAGT